MQLLLKKIGILFVITLWCFRTIYAQNLIEVKGKITTEDKKEQLAFATVIVIDGENQIVTGVLSDSLGNYIIKEVMTPSYRIVCGAQSYLSDTVKAAFIRDTTLDFILRTLTTTVVQIVARKPVIERKIDRLVFYVAQSMVAESGSAWDALKVAPTVTADNQGAVSVRGKSVIVMIDEKRVRMSGEQLMAYLSSIKSDAILKIEIISNPSAKYEAEGNSGIINIVMKKDQRLGLNGSVRSMIERRTFGRYSQGVSLNYRTSKVNVFSNYSYSWGKHLNKETMGQTYVNNNIKTRFDQDLYRVQRPLNHFLRAGIDYTPDKRSTLGMLITGFGKDLQDVAATETRISNPEKQPDSSFFTLNNIRNQTLQGMANLNYKYLADTLGSYWNADIDYLQFQDKSYTTYNSDFFTATHTSLRPSLYSKSDNQQHIRIMTAKVDYVKYTAKGLQWEAGLKEAYTAIQSEFIFENKDNTSQQYVYDSTRSNTFEYQENIAAAYLSVAYEGDKWSYKMGVRGEHTYSNSFSFTLDSTVKRQYLRLFPTFYLQYIINKKQTVGINYGRRIQRPAFWELNPFRIYLTPYSYSEGNPFLQPAFTHNVECNWGYGDNLNVSLYYQNTQNYFLQVPYQENDKNIFIYTRTNLAKNEAWGATIQLALHPFEWWSIQNNIDGWVDIQNATYLGGKINYQIAVLNYYGVHSFQIAPKRKFTAELTTFYNSPMYNGIFKTNHIANISIGVRKKWLEDKLSASLYMFDVFKTDISRNTVNYLDQQNFFNAYRDSRGLRLSLSYNFGSKSVQSARSRSTGNVDEKNRIGGQ